MKVSIKNVIIVMVAISIGLGAGYFIFGNNQESETATDTSGADEVVKQTSADPEIWTCSMHPHIRQNEPGDCPICGMELIPLEGNSSTNPLVLEMTNEAIKLANIQTTIIGEEVGQSGKTIPLSGKVQSDERLASSQVAHVPGRIEKLFVTFTGEQVNKGQKIATLYSPDLITAQRELLEAFKLKELNPELVEAARNKLRYWKIENTTIEAIEQEGKIQETFDVIADESGIVTNRKIAVGDYVKQGEPLFDLMNLSSVWVQFDAYEEDLASIEIGNRIEFTTPSIPNKTFRTQVTFIDPIINPVTRVASVRTEVNNPGGILKPEMFVYGTLQKKSSGKTQLTVPKTAVLWTGKRSVVYIKVPDISIPSFQFREVEIGERLGSSYQILAGLEIGEEVVTNGSFTIDAAAQLNNQASMMNRDVMIKGEDYSNQLPDYTGVTPLAFKQQLANVSESYLQLKDALVASENKQANISAQEINKALNQMDMGLVKDAAHLFWMDQLNALQQHSSEIVSLNDLEEQRKQFDFLSQTLIETIKVFGVPGDTLYVEHCPMALDNQGADWLSKEKEIRNPYFGEKMMSCGTVVTTIDTEFKNPPMHKPGMAQPSVHNH